MTAEATDAGSTVKRSTPDTTYDLTHKGTERIHVVDTTIKTDANFESTHKGIGGKNGDIVGTTIKTDANFESTHKGIGGKTGDIVGTTTTQTGSTEVNNSNPLLVLLCIDILYERIWSKCT